MDFPTTATITAIATIIRNLIPCLLAVSCQSSPPSWKVSETKSRHPSYQACSISQKPDNPYRGMELEFVRTSSRTHAYLNVFSLTFPSDRLDENKTKVVIKIEDEEQIFLAHRLEGGQRLLLPEDARDLLVQALLENKPVAMIAGRFDVKISPGNFSKKHCQKINLYEKR